MGEPSIMNTRVLQRNPFPGIRPFTSAEDKFFFGRETAISEVKSLLMANRFVALAGASGSGKSSLVQSGVIPALLSGNNREWIPLTVRPGLKPMENLGRGFQKVFPNKLQEADMQSFLSGNLDPGELISRNVPGSHQILLVVDQFEELFRIGPAGKRSTKNPEIERFVNMLTRAVKDDSPGIYVIIVLRSDFIEACSPYRALTELMNRSKFLLSQMTGDALARVITGPVKQAGASVEPGFAEYLLDDMEEMNNELLLLQHAMMRTWDHWSRHDNLDQPISIADYQAIGTLKTALVDHIEEAYGELDERQRRICERMFRTITSRSDQHSGFRRPATIGNIARIAQCGPDEVIEVVETFRRPGRSFLVPGPGKALSADSYIEISHELLIGLWDRLQAWVDEEAESIRMYMRLSEASALYQQGRTELLKPPELQVALNWRETQKPNPAWGVQFNPAFERAMVFLSTSEEEYLWEEERKVIRQRRRLMLNRAIAISMGVLVVVLAVVFLNTRNRTVPTGQTDPPARQDDLSAQSADRQPSIPVEPVVPDGTGEGAASTEEQPGEPGESGLQAAGEDAEGTRTDRGSAQDRAGEPRTATGDPLQQRATDRQRSAQGETARQQVRTGEGTGTGQAAAGDVRAGGAESRQRMLATARDAARSSTEITGDPDLQGLLAFQAFQINSRYNGLYYDTDIYQGLYAAMKKLVSPAYNIYPNIRNSVKDMEWLSRTGSILMVSSDGTVKILSGNLANRASQISLQSTGLNNECLAVSPDGRLAAIGTNGGGMLFIELENRGNVVHRNEGLGNIVLFLANLGSTGSLVSAGTDNRILRWEYSTFEVSELVRTSARISALGASPDGRKVAFATRDGKLFEMDAVDPAGLRQVNDFGRNTAWAVAYGPGGQILTAGLLDGTVRVMAGSDRPTIATLRGPGARVADLAYSPDGRFLAAASHDGNVYLWSSADWESRPVVFDENNGFVLSVCFNGNSGYFYSGSSDYPRLIGRPTEASRMVEDFCALVGRNLTRSEWELYFGNGIPYEKTCPDK